MRFVSTWCPVCKTLDFGRVLKNSAGVISHVNCKALNMKTRRFLQFLYIFFRETNSLSFKPPSDRGIPLSSVEMTEESEEC